MLFTACTETEDGNKPAEPSGDYTAMVKKWIANDPNHDNLWQEVTKFLRSKNAITPIFEVSNPQAVTPGAPKAPSFTINSPLTLFCVYTYHWDYILDTSAPSVVYSWLEDANGKAYGKNATTHWQYGQNGKEKAGWYTFPLMTIPAGTYTVRCSSPDTWSHNTNSNQYGFCAIYGIPEESEETPNTDPQPSQEAWDIETLRIRGTIHGTSPDMDNGAPQQMAYDIHFIESNTITTKLKDKGLHVEAQMEKSFMGTINSKLTFDIDDISKVASKKAVIRNLKLEHNATTETSAYTANTSAVYSMDKIPMTGNSSGNYTWEGTGNDGVSFNYNSTIVMDYSSGSQTTKYSLYDTPNNTVQIEMTLAR